MDAFIELLDVAMPTIQTVPHQGQTSQLMCDTTSHVWMRPCPRCSFRLRKNHPKNHGVVAAVGKLIEVVQLAHGG